MLRKRHFLKTVLILLFITLLVLVEYGCDLSDVPQGYQRQYKDKETGVETTSVFDQSTDTDITNTAPNMDSDKMVHTATIGDDTPGAETNIIGPQYINADRVYVPADAIQAESLYLYVANQTIGGRIRCAVYADDAGAPGALLMTTEEVIDPKIGWNRLSLENPPIILDPGEHYWLAMWTNAAYHVQADSTAGLSWYVYRDYASDWPAVMSSGTHDSYRHNIYLEGKIENTEDIQLQNTLGHSGYKQ